MRTKPLAAAPLRKELSISLTFSGPSLEATARAPSAAAPTFFIASGFACGAVQRYWLRTGKAADGKRSAVALWGLRAAGVDRCWANGGAYDACAHCSSARSSSGTAVQAPWLKRRTRHARQTHLDSLRDLQRALGHVGRGRDTAAD